MNKFFIFSVSTPDQILYDIEELANVTEDYIGPELTHLYEVRVYNGPWGLEGCVYLCIQWYVPRATVMGLQYQSGDINSKNKCDDYVTYYTTFSTTHVHET